MPWVNSYIIANKKASRKHEVYFNIFTKSGNFITAIKKADFIYMHSTFSTCHPPPREDNQQQIIILMADTPYNNPHTSVSAINIQHSTFSIQRLPFT